MSGGSLTIFAYFQENTLCRPSCGSFTCSIRGAPHISGQHLDGGCALGVLAQSILDLSSHSLFHLQQLFFGQPELCQRLGNLTCLIRQPGSPGCYHCSPFATSTLREQEANIRLWHQTTHSFVQPAGIPGRNRGCGFKSQSVLLVWNFDDSFCRLHFRQQVATSDWLIFFQNY